MYESLETPDGHQDNPQKQSRSLVANLQSLIFVLTIIFAVAIGPDPIFASCQNGERITLSEAIQIALEKNATLSAARYAREASGHRLKKAKADLFPKADVRIGYSRLDPGTVRRGNIFVDIGRSLVETFNTGDPNDIRPGAYQNNFSSLLQIVQPIYNGGANWAVVSLAKSQESRSEYAFEDTKQQIVLEVKTGYLRVLQAQELLVLAQKSLQSANEHLKTAQRMLAVGMRNKTDVLRWEVEMANNEGLVVEAEINQRLAFASLKQAMGLEQEDEFGVVPLIFEPDSIMGSLEEQVRTTRARHPSLKAVESTLDAQRSAIRLAWAAFRPKINFVYQFGWEQNNTLALDSFSYWSAGISVNIPVFHSFSNLATLQESKAELRRLEEVKVESERAMSFAVLRARLNVQSAYKRFQIAKKAVAHTQENLRVLNNTYKVGLASNIDVLDAEVIHRKAQTDLIQARYDFLIARAQLDRAMGVVTD